MVNVCQKKKKKRKHMVDAHTSYCMAFIWVIEQVLLHEHARDLVKLVCDPLWPVTVVDGSVKEAVYLRASSVYINMSH